MELSGTSSSGEVNACNTCESQVHMFTVIENVAFTFSSLSWVVLNKNQVQADASLLGGHTDEKGDVIPPVFDCAPPRRGSGNTPTVHHCIIP